MNNPLTSILILICAVLLAAGAGGVYGFARGGSQAEDRAAKVFSEHLAADRTAEAAALARTNKTNTAINNAVTEAANTAYQKGFKDAEANRARTVADLRSGNLQLQDRWAGCQAALVSSDSGARAAAEQYAREREESAGRIVQIADESDAQISGLQQAYNAVKAQLDKYSSDSSQR